MTVYLYMIKIKILLAFTYKYEFYINLLTKIILLFATVFFWRAAYNGIDTVSQVNEQQMLIYAVMALVMTSVFKPSVEDNIRRRVRMGNVAVDFIKPINVFGMYFSEDIGNSVTSIIQSALPILIFSALFIVNPMPVSVISFILFLISTCLSFVILWLLAAIFASFYFWVIDMGPLGNIKNYLIMILSGSFIPVWFFPKGLQIFLNYLPFVYIYQHPIGIYIGRTSYTDALRGMIIQIFWITAFMFLFNKIRKRVETNVLVQGG